jgi:hypothetical protein
MCAERYCRRVVAMSPSLPAQLSGLSIEHPSMPFQRILRYLATAQWLSVDADLKSWSSKLATEE